MPRINPDHIAFARQLRTEPTDAERELWRHLKSGQMGGVKSRRQHPVGVYVLDFACVQRHMAIELDGGQHAEDLERDEQRTAWLAQRGWRVLRFWNNEVMASMDGVLTVIAQTLREAGTRPPPAERAPASMPEPFAGLAACGSKAPAHPQPSPCQGEGAFTPSPSEGDGREGGAA